MNLILREFYDILNSIFIILHPTCLQKMSVAFDSYPYKIVTISFLEFLKIHIFSFIWGLWSVVKQIFWRLYCQKKAKDERESAPTCLVDNTFGQHLYVKLKVSLKFRVHCTLTYVQSNPHSVEKSGENRMLSNT